MSHLRTEERFSAVLEELASRSVPAELPVRGASMRPFLRDGDRLQLAPGDGTSVPLGMVAVWLSDEGPVTHRLLARWRGLAGGRILTKGDGCWRLDPPQPVERVVACALAVRRGQTVYRLDRGWRRWIGLTMAAASLASGLGAEAWDRLASRRGWP